MSASRPSSRAAALPAASSAATRRSMTAPTEPSVPPPAPAASPSTPTPSSARPTTTLRRAARCSTASSRATAPRSAPRSSAPTASSACRTRALPASMASRARRRRRASTRASTWCRTRCRRRASGGCAARASIRSASGSARPITSTASSPSTTPPPRPNSSSARASPTRSRRRASRSSTSPSPRASGALTGAVGIHVDNRKTRGESFEGDSLLEPAHTQSAALFWFEELALTQALRVQAATRVERTTVDGLGWSDVTDPAAPVVFAGERAFVPVSGGLGLLYALPFGVEARLNGQYVERAPDAAELFSKGMHEATGTFEIGNPFLNEEKASTIEIGLKKATGPFRFDASTYYTQLSRLHLSPAHRRHLRHRTRRLRPAGSARGRVRPGRVPAARRDVLRRRACRPVRRGADLERRMGRRCAVRLRPRPVRGRRERAAHSPAPPRRRRLLSRCELARPRRRCCTPSTQDEFGINEIATPGYTLVSAELSYTTLVKAPDGTASQVTVGVKGENLADDEVLNHTSFKRREEVLQPGASVRAFGIVKLN